MSRVPSGGRRHPRPRPAGNKKFVEATSCRVRMKAAAASRAGREGESEDAFRFVLTREEFLDLFLDDLELPDLAKRKLAESNTRVFAGRVTRSPARPRTFRSAARCAARSRGAWRCAGRGRRRSRSSKQSCRLRRRAAHCPQGGNRSARAPDAANSLYRSHRHPLSPLRERTEADCQAVMFCLMDVSGSMSEHMKDLAKRFYMLLYVFLTRRYRHVEIVFIGTPTGPRGGRGNLLPQPRFGRHDGLQRARGDAPDRQSALPAADWNIYAARRRTRQLLCGRRRHRAAAQ